MAVPELVGDYTRTYLTMRPEDSKAAADIQDIAWQTIAIVFYEDGIRQLAALGGRVGAKDNIRGFTFPNTLDAPITIQGAPDFGTAEIKIKRATLALGDRQQDVMLAETKLVEESASYTFHEVMAYAPGVGPVLLCSGSLKTELSCLRWVATDERRCSVLATQLCAGKDPAACDEVLMKLMADPKDGHPMMSHVSERDCDKALADPAALEALRTAHGL
jgi:hypothetical protein